MTEPGRRKAKKTTPKAARQQRFVAAVLRERRAQDRQWGGDKHDDTHSLEDFFCYIDRQMSAARSTVDRDSPFRRLVKIAALAMAAHEMLQRENGGSDD